MKKNKIKKSKIVFPNGKELELTPVIDLREIIEITIETNRMLARSKDEDCKGNAVKFTKSCLDYITRIEAWKEKKVK